MLSATDPETRYGVGLQRDRDAPTVVGICLIKHNQLGDGTIGKEPTLVGSPLRYKESPLGGDTQ
jgi:hypothetical protein